MTQEIATKDYIDTALKSFTVTDLAIEELNKKYNCLEIKNLDDKAGYKAVVEARKDVKARRVEVEKKRKELTADALAIQKGINAEAKRITELLEPIESALEAKESWFEEQQARIKKEAEERALKLYQDRVKRLVAMEYKFDGLWFKSEYDQEGVNNNLLHIATDEQIEAVLNNCDNQYEKFCIARDEEIMAAAELKRRADELQKKHEAELEAKRLEDLAIKEAQQKAEREELEAKAAALKEQEDRLKAEREAFEESLKVEKIVEVPILPPETFEVSASTTTEINKEAIHDILEQDGEFENIFDDEITVTINCPNCQHKFEVQI